MALFTVNLAVSITINAEILYFGLVMVQGCLNPLDVSDQVPNGRAGISVPISLRFFWENVLCGTLIERPLRRLQMPTESGNHPAASALTSDFVHMIPILDSDALLASSNTPIIPASVVARPM